MKNDTSLNVRIQAYAERDPVRFHVPSHKGRSASDYADYSRDITELSFSDNLNSPHDVLARAEAETAEIFGAEDTIFSTNGASACVLAAIGASVSRGQKLLLPTNAHISCYYGAMHADCDIVYARVADPIAGLSAAELSRVLSEENDIAACVLTDPTYFGCAGELESMIAMLHERGITAIVDAAHGAHFVFSPDYPTDALSAGADIVIHSAHKSLNALTQCGLLHCANKRVDSRALRFRLGTFCSSSPSYILIASIIDAVNEAKHAQTKLNTLKVCYNNTKELCADIGIPLVNSVYAEAGYIRGIDYMKLPLGIYSPDISAAALSDILEREYDIYSEMTFGDIVLCYAGLNSLPRDYERLCAALLECARSYAFEEIKPEQIRSGVHCRSFELERALPLRDAVNSQSVNVPLCDAEGRISAVFASVYPPGNPCVTPGEVLSGELLNYLSGFPDSRLSGVGAQGISVVK